MNLILKHDQLAMNLPNSFHSQIITYYGKRIMSRNITKWTNKGVTVCVSKKRSPKPSL